MLNTRKTNSLFCLLALFFFTLFYLTSRFQIMYNSSERISITELGSRVISAEVIKDGDSRYGVIKVGSKNKREANVDRETYSNEWLDRTDSKIFRRYTNSTSCPQNIYYDDFREMLQYWINIAESLGIRYFLTDGSLLGAWRDGDIIPYDYDLDIRVHVDDLPKLLPLRQKKKSWNPYKDPGYHVYFTKDWRLPYHMRRRFSCFGKEVNVYEGECSFTDPPARLINDDRHIDIFIYQTYENVLQFFPTKPTEYLKTDILPLVKCWFLNETTWCPRKPKHILDQIYSLNLTPGKICKNKEWVDKNA